MVMAARSPALCALLTTGSLDCWGPNQFGEVGDGSTTFTDVPVAVVGLGGTGHLNGVQEVSIGYTGVVGARCSRQVASTVGAMRRWVISGTERVVVPTAVADSPVA